jgi:gamma-glutamyltranspeptidase
VYVFYFLRKPYPNAPDRIRSIRIQAEDGFAPGVLDQLQAMGHDIQLISRRGELRMGYSAAIMIKDGQVIAGGDPRRSGEARTVER